VGRLHRSARGLNNTESGGGGHYEPYGYTLMSEVNDAWTSSCGGAEGPEGLWIWKQQQVFMGVLLMESQASRGGGALL